MASGKRVVGTIALVIVMLATFFFVFVLYAKSVNDTDIPFASDITTLTAIIAGTIGLVITVLLLLILIRSAEERRNLRLESEEEARRREEEERARQFEASLTEPDNLGKGPEIVVYSLGSMPHMFHAYERMNRRTKIAQYTFPRTVDDAIYSSEMIDVGQGIKLKLRTLIAGPKDATKKELAPIHLKRAPVNIDPKSVDEPWRSRLLGEEPATAAPSAEPQAGTAGSPGGDLGAQIDAHLGGATNGAAKGSRPYYDYSGQVHHVEDIEGIGRLYGDKLRQAGVHTTARLSYEDPEELAARVGVPRKTVETWQAMSELIKVQGIGPQFAEALARAGVQGIADLKRRDAGEIAQQVNAYLDSLQTNVLGSRITEKRVESWQKAAAKMRRIRLKVPEK
jgi:predicted flap endonuclease-1-like 5' DNA nuclease